MKKLRVLLLVHEELLPPPNAEELDWEETYPYQMELDVQTTLRALGHEVATVGVGSDLDVIRDKQREFEPDIAFNILTDFHDITSYEAHVVSYFELLKLPYTGCNPRGLLAANDKALFKKVLAYHRIRAPRFFVVPRGKRLPRLPKGLRWPLFVKSRSEHASTGISQASIVHDLDQLQSRVTYIHEAVGTGALCEEYIEGRELTVGVLGNKRVEISPIWELFMDDLPAGVANIATSRVKWDPEYQRKIGLRTGPAEDLDAATVERIRRTARRIHRAVGLSGYSRIDMRMDSDGQVWILEANPNPDLCFGEDFAESFERRGYSYPQLIQKILNLGLRYEAPWMG